MMQRLRYNEYTGNNKSGQFLANQLQHKTEKSIITPTIDSTGKNAQSSEEIKHIFQLFYCDLYSSKIT